MLIDVEARAKKRLKAEADRRAAKYPFPCPKCFSPVGDRCRTIKGVPTLDHILRHPFYANAKDMVRYPAACPVCKRGEGQNCVSLYTGKRVHSHRDRPQR